jgi:hypothetical protein
VNRLSQPAESQPPELADPAIADPPQHPMHALTTYELSRYRRELEHALKVLPEDAPVRELLQDRLAEVFAEEDSRTRIADAAR